MDVPELRELLSTDGLRLLDSLPPFDSSADVVAAVAQLRKLGHPPGLVAAVLTQSRLRARAAAKFGPFADRMLFTEPGLEQATRLRVAALHAGRYRDAGLTDVVDLGSGIGADSLAMAAIDIRVTAVELDEVTAAIASYNLDPGPTRPSSTRLPRPSTCRRSTESGSIRHDAPVTADCRTPPTGPRRSTSPSAPAGRRG